jgi:hypothetical protein
MEWRITSWCTCAACGGIWTKLRRHYKRLLTMQTNKIGRPPPIEAFGAVIKAYYKRRELRYEVCVELNKL